MNCPTCNGVMMPSGFVHTVHVCYECRYVTTGECTQCGDCFSRQLEGKKINAVICMATKGYLREA